MTSRKIRIESDYGLPEPRPLAGPQAALSVPRLTQDQEKLDAARVANRALLIQMNRKPDRST
ncbi:hypothetical protein [Micromonospora sp. NPDC051141]|uniref:hypothetical protein n=1 Tax=Micromonospora sp. NPDC051141 TaxID=3364284 RepID=UPI0037B04B03